MEADPSKHAGPPIVAEPGGPAVCPNCGTDFQGAYCSSCGQKDEPLRQSTVYFVREALIEVFGIDGRFWLTMRQLIFHPGSLTRSYIHGHRRQYIRPLRLYLTITLLFFFALSLYDPIGRVQNQLGAAPASDTTATAHERIETINKLLRDDQIRLQKELAAIEKTRIQTDSLSNRLGAGDSTVLLLATRRLARAGIDSVRITEQSARRRNRFLWQRDILREYPPDSTIRPADLATASTYLFPGSDSQRNDVNLGLPDWAVRNAAIGRMREARTNDEFVGAIVEFVKAMIGRIPAVMFVLLPVFALLLKALYANQRIKTLARPAVGLVARVAGRDSPPRTETAWYYTEHLIFGLHVHAFLFLIFGLIVLIIAADSGTIIPLVAVPVLLLWAPVYFIIAMKRVYGQGLLKTFAKAGLLGFSYSFLLVSVGVALTTLLAAILG